MNWRSVGAVIGGFAVTATLSIATDGILHAMSVFPPMGVRMSDPLFVLAATYRALFTVVGGYTTARLAPRTPMRHAMGLAIVGSFTGALGIVVWANGGDAMGPLWYTLSIPLSAFPCIGAGAWLARRTMASSSRA